MCGRMPPPGAAFLFEVCRSGLSALGPHFFLQVCKGLECRGCWSGFPAVIAGRIHHFGVLLIMAIETEQFPVAAISGIVIMIMIPVMHRKLPQVLMGELPPAATANPWEKAQRLFPIPVFLL